RSPQPRPPRSATTATPYPGRRRIPKEPTRSTTQDAARAAAAGCVGGMLATYAWLVVLALVGTRVPAPPPPVLGVTMGLMGAAIILQAYFILNPPPTDAEWATQRFWSVAAVGLSVALAALPILLTVSVSVPVAIIAAGVIGVI